MRESALVSRIMKELKAAGAKAIKCHGSVYMEAGTPDIVGTYRPFGKGSIGRTFALECKVGKNEPTPIQWLRIKEWREAGAVVVVAKEDFNVQTFLALM